jgi:hypothetical protein
MSLRDFYHRRAEECLRVSKSFGSASEENELFQVAQRYLTLARHVSAWHHHATPRHDADDLQDHREA